MRRLDSLRARPLLEDGQRLPKVASQHEITCGTAHQVQSGGRAGAGHIAGQGPMARAGARLAAKRHVLERRVDRLHQVAQRQVERLEVEAVRHRRLVPQDQLRLAVQLGEVGLRRDLAGLVLGRRPRRKREQNVRPSASRIAAMPLEGSGDSATSPLARTSERRVLKQKVLPVPPGASTNAHIGSLASTA